MDRQIIKLRRHNAMAAFAPGQPKVAAFRNAAIIARPDPSRITPVKHKGMLIRMLRPLACLVKIKVQHPVPALAAIDCAVNIGRADKDDLRIFGMDRQHQRVPGNRTAFQRAGGGGGPCGAAIGRAEHIRGLADHGQACGNLDHCANGQGDLFAQGQFDPAKACGGRKRQVRVGQAGPDRAGRIGRDTAAIRIGGRVELRAEYTPRGGGNRTPQPDINGKHPRRGGCGPAAKVDDNVGHVLHGGHIGHIDQVLHNIDRPADAGVTAEQADIAGHPTAARCPGINLDPVIAQRREGWNIGLGDPAKGLPAVGRHPQPGPGKTGATGFAGADIQGLRAAVADANRANRHGHILVSQTGIAVGFKKTAQRLPGVAPVFGLPQAAKRGSGKKAARGQRVLRNGRYPPANIARPQRNPGPGGRHRVGPRTFGGMDHGCVDLVAEAPGRGIQRDPEPRGMGHSPAVNRVAKWICHALPPSDKDPGFQHTARQARPF